MARTSFPSLFFFPSSPSGHHPCSRLSDDCYESRIIGELQRWPATPAYEFFATWLPIRQVPNFTATYIVGIATRHKTTITRKSTGLVRLSEVPCTTTRYDYRCLICRSARSYNGRTSTSPWYDRSYENSIVKLIRWNAYETLCIRRFT